MVKAELVVPGRIDAEELVVDPGASWGGALASVNHFQFSHQLPAFGNQGSSSIQGRKGSCSGSSTPKGSGMGML